MNLVFTMFISIFIKAISAIVEIAIQMLITNRVGVSEYGNYAFFVSLIDGGFFFLFSSSIKLNSFYLSTPSSSLKSFKKKFLLYYILPIISVMIIAFIIMRSLLGVIAAIAILVYYFAHDTISKLCW